MAAASEMKNQELCTEKYNSSEPLDGITADAVLSEK